MIVIDRPFPEKCRECVLWKIEFCSLLNKKIKYQDADKRDKDCPLIATCVSEQK